MSTSLPESPAESQAPPEPTGPAQASVALLLTAVVMALFLSVGVAAQVMNLGFGLWFSEIFVFLAVPFVTLRATGRDPVGSTGLSLSPWGPAVFGFLVGAANFFAVVVLLQSISLRLAPDWMRQLFDATRIFRDATPAELALIISGVSIAAPICEEYLFRGILQRGLMTRLGPSAAVVITALLFSAFHLEPIGFLARFELGVVFGLLYWRSGSLWPGILAHAANNTVSTLLYFAGQEAAGQDQEPSLLTVLWLSLLGVGLLLGVLRLPRAYPKLFPGTGAPLPDRHVAAGPGLLTLAAPWLAGALAALALLWGIDRRGVQLNLFDARHPIPERRDAGEPLLESQAELKRLRQAARKREVPIDEYFKAREALWQQTHPSVKEPDTSAR